MIKLDFSIFRDSLLQIRQLLTASRWLFMTVSIAGNFEQGNHTTARHQQVSVRTRLQYLMALYPQTKTTQNIPFARGESQ